MFDRATFLRPIAHRGLHSTAAGVIENSAPAFEAAIAAGYGIECDLQPAADGAAMVFHDESLSRLVDAPGRICELSPQELSRLCYRGDAKARILRLAELLELVAGRVPILVDVKSAWETPDPRFISAIACDLAAYRGAVAIMSFDPAMVAALKPRLPGIPRGIVSGLYDASWSGGKLDEARSYRLSHLIESRAAEPDFFAYNVEALPTAVTRFLREGLGVPLFAWTVRTPEDLDRARVWADAPIFEDIDPRRND
jgi:glycerophosphoryl diester phosphodiesterase